MKYSWEKKKGKTYELSEWSVGSSVNKKYERQVFYYCKKKRISNCHALLRVSTCHSSGIVTYYSHGEHSEECEKAPSKVDLKK